MAAPLALLKFVAKAGLNAVAGGVGGDFAVEVLPEIARDIWTWWAKDRSEAQRKADVQALVQAPPAEVQRQVKEVVREVAGAVPVDKQLQLETYLNEIPSVARQSLMRRDDPRGSTIPSHRPLQKPDDLLSFLPQRLPRFNSGDRPLKNVDWELVKLLGVGGFGEVWKARNPHAPNLQAALKFCLDPTARDQLLKYEAGVLARVMSQGGHPGIVRLRQTYLSADTPCLEYEFIEGGDLTGAIHNYQATKGPLPPDMATKIVLYLARAVGHVHKLSPPIVHRDLKPANVLVRTKEGKSEFLITDFGIGGVVTSQALEQTRRGTTSQPMLTSVKGAHTPLYASPEQKRGEPPDPRDDVHALGIIWYQMLVGDFSVGAPAGSAWKKTLTQRGLSEPLLQLLESCFETEAQHRPANAAVLAERISELIKPPPFEQHMKDALEELRTKGDNRAWFERQGPARIADWRVGAEQGIAPAQWLLACCLYEGTGAQKDILAAMALLRRAADSGLPVAQTDLGDCYYTGEGAKRDPSEAFRLYTAAAAQGFAEALVDLGDCYYEGVGVEKNLATAAQFYRKAAEADWARGQDSLGDCYWDGSGVEQDYPQAISWYRKAAEMGLASAQLNLGWCYEYGKGVKKNRSEAAKWYRKAAEQGEADAQFAVGYYYEHGYGVEPDLALAEQWYRKAADQGHRRAINALRRLQEKAEPDKTGGEDKDEGDEDTTGYWVIAPYFASPEEWQQVWEFDLANNIISIGWTELGDISSLDEEELRAAIDRAYPDPDTSAQARGQYFGMLWNFFHEIKVGDVVIARRGRKKLAAVGIVNCTAYFDPNKTLSAVGDWYTYGNHLGVEWDDYPRDKEFDDQVFGMQTVYQIPEEKFCTLIGKDKPIRERWLKSMRLLLEKGAISPDSAVKFSTFRVEAKAAGGIMYGYDSLSDAGLIEWLKREDESGWFLFLTAAGSAALEAQST